MLLGGCSSQSQTVTDETTSTVESYNSEETANQLNQVLDQIQSEQAEQQAEQQTEQQSGSLGFVSEPDTSVDYDLTAMSATMIYAQVYNMISDPESYVDKTLKLEGYVEFYYIQSFDETIYFIVINDATGCCPQGIEIQFPAEIVPPEDFVDVLIKGKVCTEEYEGNNYVYIDIAEMELM